ncbi:MAG: thiamine-monophosphate kinase [Spirochaetia bacterium]|nr:thiamine-monophosphate kinase [Spirochaetia bacterium]
MEESKIIRSLYKKYSIPGDDCYFKNGYLYTTDSMAEGTHFLHEWSSPRDIAHKLFHINLSDLASSGGVPKFCFLNLGLSKFSSQSSWILEFGKSLKRELKTFQIELVGGDTYFSKTTNLTLTLIGTTDHPTVRSAGNPNESLYITGPVGYSQLGLKLIRKNGAILHNLPKQISNQSIQKHLKPRSKYKEFRELLVNHNISAAMDITDGLIQDSIKLASASKIGLEIWVETLPDWTRLLPYLRREEICTSGEELEILFLSKDKIQSPLATRIGRSFVGRKVKFLEDGKVLEFKKKGFFHF